MLKWLRQYNSYILVFGGVLLMVAFLMPQAIEQLGRQKLSAPSLSIAGTSVSMEQANLASREYHALRGFLSIYLDPKIIPLYVGETADHWIMLTYEANSAGLVGGPEDGQGMISELKQRLVDRIAQDQPKASSQELNAKAEQLINVIIGSAANEARLTQDQFLTALAKLRGVIRLKNAYAEAPRYSEVRLLRGAKRYTDTASIQYVYIPADRDVPADLKPDQTAIQAHFDKYKDIEPGEGETGIGYKQPERVKLAWLELDKNAISKAVDVDQVEVQKRFLKKYPGGEVPKGVDANAERSKIEAEVRSESVDQVMKTAEQAVRGELEKAMRSLEPDAEYKRLPADWNTHLPDLSKIAATVATRVQEVNNVAIPVPKAEVADSSWHTADGVRNTLPGIGHSFLRRDTRTTIPFSELVFKVRELAGENNFVIQAGVPSLEPTQDSAGNKYYFMVVDARKASPPDSVDEVRAEVVKNIRRLAGYQALQSRLTELESLAKSKGLDALTKVNFAAAVPALHVRSATVNNSNFAPSDPQADTQETRDAILAKAETLDPTKDIAKEDPANRTLALAVPKHLGVLIAQVDLLKPLTEERFSMMGGLTRKLQQDEMNPQHDAALAADNDPFTLAAMEKRLHVEYFDRNQAEQSHKAATTPAKTAPKS